MERLADPTKIEPCIISSVDRYLKGHYSWSGINDRLFRPPVDGVDVSIEVKVLEVKRLLNAERMVEAARLCDTIPNAPANITAPLALWRGKFKMAYDLNKKENPSSEPFSEDLNPYPKALKSHSTLPKIQDLDELAGRLHFLKRWLFNRVPLPNPSREVFSGDVAIRRQTLRHYLTRLNLHDEGQAVVLQYLRNCLEGSVQLPTTVKKLFSVLVDVENATANDLCYSDLIYRLRSVLEHTQNEQVCTYLFHLFPNAGRKRFVEELQRAKVNPVLCNELGRFPNSDGSRPLYISKIPPWSLEKFKGDSAGSLTGTATKKFPLSKAATSYMGKLIRGKKQLNGRHPVIGFRHTYFKLRPEFPGREFAYLVLRRFVTGDVYPQRELFKLELDERTFAVSASADVPGKSLQDVLDKSTQIKDLDFRQYCFDVLMTLLTLPEDDKPDNFIVYQPPNDGLKQLVNIDPDRVFFKAMNRYWLASDDIQCKSILLCLDQMKEVIDLTVRSEFLALHPAAFFDKWLQKIDKYNEEAGKLFGKDFIDQSLNGKSTCEIPFFFEPTIVDDKTGALRHEGFFLRIYKRFTTLQEALENKSRTLLDLLLAVHPQLGKHYKQQLNIIGRRAIDRFCDLTKAQYNRETGSTLSIPISKLDGKYGSCDEYRKYGWTVQNATQDLKKIIAARSSQETIIKDLIHNQGLILKTLNVPSVSDSILKAIDFSKLPEGTQTAILDHITGLKFKNLHIVGCSILTDSKLEAILHHCPNLILLDLANSKGVIAPTYLGLHCPHLKKLNLRGLSTLTSLAGTTTFSWVPLALPELEVLDISHCSLDRIDLTAKSLQELRCRGNAFPVEFALNCPPLKSISVESEAVLRHLLPFCKLERLTFKKAVIEPIDDPDALDLSKYTSVKLDNYLITYRTGPVSDAEAIAPILTFGAYRIHDPSIKATAICRKSDPLQLDVELLDVADRCPNLTSLDLSSCYKLTDKAIISLAEQCPQLTSLNLSWCEQLSDKAIISLAEQCPQLTNLNLSYCYGLGHEAIVAIAEHCKELSNLDLTCCYELTDRTVMAIAARCPALHTLKLSHGNEIGDDAVAAIAEHCKGLSNLDLTCCYKLTDKTVMAIAEHCPNLTSLNLLWCKKITDKGLIAIAEHCPNLTSLNLLRCKKITDKGLIAIAEHCPNLTSLNLSRCKKITDKGLIAIAVHCPLLTSLDVYKCKLLTDQAIVTVAQHCPQLISINLSECGKLSDRAIIAIAEKCPNLKFVDFCGCYQLTDKGIIAIAEHCTGLTSLDLSSCLWLTDNAIMAIAAQCPGLTSLKLVQNINIYDKAIMAIAAQCPALHTLKLSQCYRLTDMSIIAIAEHCKGLTHLNISECRWLTDKAIIAITEECWSLTSLNLRKCTGITDKAIDAIAAQCVSLKFLKLSGCTQLTGSSKNQVKLVHEYVPTI